MRRVSVSQITTLNWPFERDVEAFARRRSAGGSASPSASSRRSGVSAAARLRARRRAARLVSDVVGALSRSATRPASASRWRARAGISTAAAELGADCLMVLPGQRDPRCAWEEAAARARRSSPRSLPDAEQAGRAARDRADEPAPHGPRVPAHVRRGARFRRRARLAVGGRRSRAQQRVDRAPALREHPPPHGRIGARAGERLQGRHARRERARRHRRRRHPAPPHLRARSPTPATTAGTTSSSSARRSKRKATNRSCPRAVAAFGRYGLRRRRISEFVQRDRGSDENEHTSYAGRICQRRDCNEAEGQGCDHHRRGAGHRRGVRAAIRGQEGAMVVVADINAEKGEAVAAAIGGGAVFERVDVSSEDDTKRARQGGVRSLRHASTCCSTTPRSSTASTTSTRRSRT